MTSYFLALNLVTLLCMTFAHPAANDLKAKVSEDNEISGAKRVSAEFGGYKVAAGLGGGSAGGGLFARAEAPGAGAGAGLYGGAGADGGANGDKQPGGGGGFFDRIFNIPISVLHSVNSYVKTKENGHHAGASASAAVGGSDSTYSTETRFAGNENDGVVGASASASTGDASSIQKIRGKPDYDKIFQIPISALKSVNDFLNG